jgi:hypothetical protein
MLISTELLLDSNIRNNVRVCTAKLPCRRVVEGNKNNKLNVTKIFTEKMLIYILIFQVNFKFDKS